MILLWFIVLIIFGGTLVYNTKVSIIGYVSLAITYIGLLVYLFLEFLNQTTYKDELMSLTHMKDMTYASQFIRGDMARFITIPAYIYPKRVLIYGMIVSSMLLLLASILVQTFYVAMRVNQTKSADLYLDGDNNKSVNARKNLKTFNNAFLVGLIAIVLFFVSFVFTQQKQSDINYKLVIFQLVLLFIAFVSSAVSMSYSLLQKKLKTASKNTTEDEPLGYSQNIFTQTWQNLVLFFTNPVV